MAVDSALRMGEVMSSTDWKRRRVYLRDPQGRWEMEARRFMLYVTDRRPKIKGQPGWQYFVAPDIEVATVARLWTALSN